MKLLTRTKRREPIESQFQLDFLAAKRVCLFGFVSATVLTK